MESRPRRAKELLVAAVRAADMSIKAAAGSADRKGIQ